MKKLFFCAVCAVIVSGCSKEPDPVFAVKVAPMIRSRVAGLHFESGDRIGLTIQKGAEAYVRNRELTYDGSVFSCDGLMWYDDLETPSVLTAYYPYSADGQPEEFSVATDQSAGCEASDLLGAVRSGVLPASAPVAMLFHHLLAQLTVVVDNTSGQEVSEVAVGGFVPAATVDFASLSVAAKVDAAPAEIRTCPVVSDASYRAILVPQQGTLTVTVKMSDGRYSSKTLPATELESGKQYDLSVHVTSAGISLSMSGDISDWNPGGSLGEESGDDSELVYEGVTYPTASIGGKVWMAANLRCIPAGTSLGTGVWYPADGTSAVEQVGLLYNYATATNGGAPSSGASVRGICPEGWHLPTASELQAMAESPDRDETFLHRSGFWIVNGTTQRYGDSSAGYLMSCESAGTGKCRCLYYPTGSDPTLSSISVDYGISVRCVRD